MTPRRLRVTAVSLNTALDRTLRVERLRPGAVHVAAAECLGAGGKAVNVARALLALGVEARIVGLAGGAVGRSVRALARGEGLPARWFPTDGATRVCTIVVDPENGATVLNGRGPVVAPLAVISLEAYLFRRAARGDAIALTGSLPPGLPVDLYARWGDRCRALGAALVALDAHGAVLAAGLRSVPDVVKVNREEFARTAPGESLAGRARALLRSGVGLVVVTQGEDGAVAFAPDGAWRVPAARVAAVNPTGSGDVFLAGLLAGRAHGLPLSEALALAAAAAALNAARLGPGPDDLASARALARTLSPERLPADGG